MDNLVNITEEEQSKLLKEEKEYFDEIYSDLINNFSVEEQKQMIREMVRLLSITQDNYEKISSEKFLKRIIDTLTKKNKKLKDINQKNLFEIQKRVAIFLAEYARKNQILANSLNEALDSIDKLAIDQTQLRIWILELAQRNQSVERRLEELEKKKKDNILRKAYNKFTNLFKSEEYYNQENDLLKLRYCNEKLKPIVRDNIETILLNEIRESSYLSINFIFENSKKYEQFLDLTEKDEENNLDEEQKLEILKEIVYYLPIDKSMLQTNIIYSISQIINNINSFNKKLISKSSVKNFNLSIIDIPYFDKSRISENCIKQLDPMNKYIDVFLDRRKYLINKFPKIIDIFNANENVEFTKYLIRGAIPVYGQVRLINEVFFDGKMEEKLAKKIGIETKSAYLDDFCENLENLICDYSDIMNNSERFVCSAINNEFKSYIQSFINNYDIILDKFIDEDVNLEDINNYCLEKIKKNKREGKGIKYMISDMFETQMGGFEPCSVQFYETVGLAESKS